MANPSAQKEEEEELERDMRKSISKITIARSHARQQQQHHHRDSLFQNFFFFLSSNNERLNNSMKRSSLATNAKTQKSSSEQLEKKKTTKREEKEKKPPKSVAAKKTKKTSAVDSSSSSSSLAPAPDPSSSSSARSGAVDDVSVKGRKEIIETGFSAAAKKGLNEKNWIRTDSPPRAEISNYVFPHLPRDAVRAVPPAAAVAAVGVGGLGVRAKENGGGGDEELSSSNGKAAPPPLMTPSSPPAGTTGIHNVNADGMDNSTILSGLAGAAIVIGGLYSVVSSGSSNNNNKSSSSNSSMNSAKKKRNNNNDREELNINGSSEQSKNNKEEEEEQKRNQIESNNTNNKTIIAKEEEERLAEDLLIQKLREDAARLVAEEFTKAFVPSEENVIKMSGKKKAEEDDSSPSSSSSDVYSEKEVAKELSKVFEAANELLMKQQERKQEENEETARLVNANSKLEQIQAQLTNENLSLKKDARAMEEKFRDFEIAHAEKLEKAKQEFELEAQETLLAERSERMKQLDVERVKFSALKTVLSNRRKSLEAAVLAHEIVAGVAKLSENIEKGKSFEREMRVLRKVAEKDEILKAILSEKTLDTLAMKDVPTLEQLRDLLEKQVKRDARRVYLIPKEGGGMITYALSSLVSLLKVEESNDNNDNNGKDDRANTSLEAAILKAEALLRDEKNCGDAARVLMKASEGSKAKEVVESWAKSAKEREEIDFILKALNAHALAKSAGIS